MVAGRSLVLYGLMPLSVPGLLVRLTLDGPVVLEVGVVLGSSAFRILGLRGTNDLLVEGLEPLRRAALDVRLVKLTVGRYSPKERNTPQEEHHGRSPHRPAGVPPGARAVYSSATTIAERRPAW